MNAQIRSNGLFVRDYIYVSDGAAAYRTLARKMAENPGKYIAEAFNFSYELKLTVLQVVETILKKMNSSLKPEILNQANHEIPLQALDSTKSIKLLNWKPLFGFEEGVQKTIDWYKRNSNGQN